MATVGLCVGTENVWCFPMPVSRYGGLTFLISYFISASIISQPGMMQKFSFSHWRGFGPVSSFGRAMQNGGKSIGFGELMGNSTVFPTRSGKVEIAAAFFSLKIIGRGYVREPFEVLETDSLQVEAGYLSTTSSEMPLEFYKQVGGVNLCRHQIHSGKKSLFGHGEAQRDLPGKEARGNLPGTFVALPHLCGAIPRKASRPYSQSR